MVNGGVLGKVTWGTSLCCFLENNRIVERYFSSFFTSFLIDFTGVTLSHKTIQVQVHGSTKHHLHTASCAHQLLVSELLGDRSYPVYFYLFLFFQAFFFNS